MANIFDKDTASTDNHLLNEQFHAFSKSPSSPGSTLGGASNRSGHTVSASDVWAEKIPAFFYPKADSDYAVCKANAKLNDICRWGDEIQIWDGEKFVKFADNYAAIPDGHEFLNEEGQPVVRFHKSRVAYNLNDTNNAYDNSLDASGKGASAKILGWDKDANDGAGGVYTYVESAPQFITQFVAPADNIVKGVPSKGYGPIVMVGGSPLTEDADSTAGYIANNFAGIIQFNERKAQGTVTVHAFEYCGKTLGTAARDIEDLEQKVNDHLLDAAGKLEITVLADKLPKKPFFEDEVAYVNSYGFEWEKLSNNIYTNKFEVKVAQSVSGLNEFKSHNTGTVLTPSALAAQTCKLVVYSFDDATQLTEVAVSQPNTFDASTSIYAFKFDNQISLSAGVRYRICFRNADDINALHCLPVIINSSIEGAEVTKHEIPTRYIISERDVENNNDWWGCWGPGAGQLNGVQQVAYGPKVSVSGLTPTPDEDGSTLIGENGKIYLIPNTDSENQNVYDEFVWTNNTWEKIGSTKVDLTDYAKSVTINDTTYSASAANAGALNLGTVVNSVIVGGGKAVVNDDSLMGYISNGALHLGIASATSSVMGVSKMFTNSNITTAASNVTDTAVSVHTAKMMYNALANSGVVTINDIGGNLTFCVHNGVSTYNWEGDGEGEGYDTSTHANLWGTGVHTSGSNIVIMDSFVGLPWNGGAEAYLSLAALPSDAVTVENNFVMNADGKVITTIRPERMYSRFLANIATGLKSFVGDLSNLTTAVGGGFYGCSALELFIGDLSSLTRGVDMFYDCSKLKSFVGDLSSLTDGFGMFDGCKLDAESLECIADTINDVRSLATSTEVTKQIDIGYNCSAASAQAAYNAITGKGWNCSMGYNA